jgi:hypothetical protein
MAFISRIQCFSCVEDRLTTSIITCPSCNFECCDKCTRRYLLNSKNMIPDCMSCHKQWGFEFLANNTPNTFHNQTYREHRAKLLMERERSLLPATQPLVTRSLEKKKRDKEIEQFELENSELKALIYQNNNRIYELKNYFYAEDELEDKKSNVTKKAKYIAHCPKETCKGYIVDQGKCGICSQYMCSKCHQSKKSRMDENHVCKPNDVSTATLLKSDTRPCPSCAVPIFKIHGCDQMLCTSCWTAFSWDTGDVDNGYIHNPHFKEYENSHGGRQRARGDVRCGGAPTMLNIKYNIRNIIKLPYWVENAYILINHINIVVLPPLNNDVREATHSDLRLKYLMDDIDESKWLSELKKRVKKREKEREVYMMMQMFSDTLGDLFSNLQDIKTEDEAVMIMMEMYDLKHYTQKELKKVSRRYKNFVPNITDDWIMDD